MRTGSFDLERWEKIQKLPLRHGAHQPDSQFCVMEAVAYIAGEPWSDHPACVPPSIASVLRSWNDALPTDDDRNRLLKPLIPKLFGLASYPEIEEKRWLMVGDHLIRSLLPAILRFAGDNAGAEKLEALPEITSAKQLESALALARSPEERADFQARIETGQSALVERMIACEATGLAAGEREE